jgi:DNA-binding NtrC family response regulator
MKYRTFKYKRWRDLEREFILAALFHFHGNRKDTAEAIGMGRRTLGYKLTAYMNAGFDVPKARSGPRKRSVF